MTDFRVQKSSQDNKSKQNKSPMNFRIFNFDLLLSVKVNAPHGSKPLIFPQQKSLFSCAVFLSITMNKVILLCLILAFATTTYG